MNKYMIVVLLVCICGMIAGCGTQPTFATSWSVNADPALAGREAARKAIAKLADAPLQGLVFTVYYQKKGFASSDPTKYLPDIKAEQAAARAVAEVVGEMGKGIPNIGCRGRGLANGGTLLKRGVVVLAIGGDQVRCAATAAAILDSREKTGRQVARGLRKLGGSLKLIFVMSEMRLSFEDKRNVKHEDMIRGIIANSPRGVVIMGGNGMNDPAATKAKSLAGVEFVNGKPMEGQVAAMGIAGPIQIYTNHTNEFKPRGKVVLVTKARGKWIITLNDKPAAAVYRKIRKMGKNEKFTCDWQHPLGVIVGPGKCYLQMILNWVDKNGRDKDGKKSKLPPGSLRLPTPVAGGTKLKIMTGGNDAKAIIASARENIAESLARVKADKLQPVLALVSSCCTRDMRLRAFAAGKKDEVRDGILPAMGKKFPVFGFYTYGSIGPLQGKFRKMNHAFQQHTFLSAIVAVTADDKVSP